MHVAIVGLGIVQLSPFGAQQLPGAVWVPCSRCLQTKAINVSHSAVPLALPYSVKDQPPPVPPQVSQPGHGAAGAPACSVLGGSR